RPPGTAAGATGRDGVGATAPGNRKCFTSKGSSCDRGHSASRHRKLPRNCCVALHILCESTANRTAEASLAVGTPRVSLPERCRRGGGVSSRERKDPANPFSHSL